MLACNYAPILVGSVQLVNPRFGTLVHGDVTHLNADGARRLEQVFRRYVYDQVVC